MMSPVLRFGAFIPFLVLCSAVLSQDAKVADAISLRSRVERGPVIVEVTVTPARPQLSDEPVLTLTVTAKSDVHVELPPFGESLGDFIIRDFHEPLPKTSDGDQVLQQVYTLEPTSAGNISIDPITVRFVDKREDGDGKEHEVQTEALLVDVQTMVASDAPSLNDLRTATDPIELPESPRGSTIAIIAICLLLLAGLIFILWSKKRRQPNALPELTPQQLAHRELIDLLGSKLSETDVKEFFVQLTAVVRRYIERTTGVNAPDQTTEEFLREVNQQNLFADADNTRLEAFLESADLVKFAGYQPDEESIRDSTHRAEQFIEFRSVPNSTEASVAEPVS